MLSIINTILIDKSLIRSFGYQSSESMIGRRAYPYQLLLESKTNAGPAFSNALICQQILRVCHVTGPTKRVEVTREWEGTEMGSRNTSASEQEHFGILRMEIYIIFLINHCHHNNRKRKRRSTCDRQHIR